MTSLKLEKLIVNLRNEDRVSIGDILKTVGKSKSVIHSILRKLEKTASCETTWVGIGKLMQRKTDGLVMNQKRIDLRQQLLSRK